MDLIATGDKGIEIEKWLGALPEYTNFAIKLWHPYILYWYDAALALAKAAQSVQKTNNRRLWTGAEHWLFKDGRCPINSMKFPLTNI